MQLTETKEIIRQVALVDNRKVSTDTIEAWHNIIGRIPFDIAQEALKLAQQDASIKYLEPRHIVAWAKEAAFRLDRHKPKAPQQEFVKVEQPNCRAHGLPVLSCRPCCREMSKHDDLTPPALLAWAKQNIYA
jgi:hypothetical protein